MRWFPAAEELRSTACEKLLPPLVAKVREEVKAWRDKGYAGALRLLERHEKERDEAFLQLRAKLETGAAQAERGELLNGDDVFEELREMLEERRRARIPAAGASLN